MTQPVCWRTAHVYYHEPDHSDLLLQAVQPLLEEVSDDGGKGYVIPHWRRGPHLRINVHVLPHVWSRKVHPAIERTIGGYLAQHPSTVRLDEKMFLAQHRQLAAMERETGPISPWAANNTIEYPPCHPRADRTGGQRWEELVTDFYVASTPFHFDMVRHLKNTHRPNDLACLALLFATATTVGGLRLGAGSFRSNAEGFLNRCPDPEAERAVFQLRYTRHRDTFRGLMRHVVATLNGSADVPHPLVAPWAALMQRCLEHAGFALGDRVVPLPRAERAQTDDHPDSPADRHTPLARDSSLVCAPGSPEFDPYHLILNLTYRQLSRTGIPPSHRYLLCHIAANAIEENAGDGSGNCGS